MPPRLDRLDISIPSDDPEGDQSYRFADGTRITTDDPNAQGEMKEVFIAGNDRRKISDRSKGKYSLGELNAVKW